MEELSAGELIEELEDVPLSTMGGGRPGDASPIHVPHAPNVSTVEVPVVLDRSLFSGDSPIEIRLKLYIK